jgi:hypothetical protein
MVASKKGDKKKAVAAAKPPAGKKKGAATAASAAKGKAKGSAAAAPAAPAKGKKGSTKVGGLWHRAGRGRVGWMEQQQLAHGGKRH